jgi:hypothetical protein
MKRLAFLTAVITVIAFGTASAFKVVVPGTPTAAEPPPVTISVDELHRHVDMRSLPELEIHDLY